MPRANVRTTSCARWFWVNGSPMLRGMRSRSRSEIDFWARRLRRGPARSARRRPRADQVRQRQPDDHGDQRIEQVEGHHEAAQAAPDLVGHDRAQDRQDDQRGRQGRQGAQDQLRAAVPGWPPRRPRPVPRGSRSTPRRSPRHRAECRRAGSRARPGSRARLGLVGRRANSRTSSSMSPGIRGSVVLSVRCWMCG